MNPALTNPVYTNGHYFKYLNKYLSFLVSQIPFYPQAKQLVAHLHIYDPVQ